MRRRLALTGLAVLATLTFGAACTTAPGTPAPATTKSATEVLSDAAAKTKGESFTYKLTYGALLTGDGKQDGAGQNAESNLTISEPTSGMTIKASVRSVGGDLFIKLDLGPVGASLPGFGELKDKWMHVDKSKLGSGGLAGSLTPGGDNMTAESYVKGVVTAEKVSDTEIKGTLDLTKSAPAGLDSSDVAALGEDAKKVPFVMTLDSEGRVTKVVISMPKVGEYPASELTTTYADYGTTVTVEKPSAAETAEAPALVYQFLGATG
ncbi:MAG TPA: hypothetical protein VF163_21995 [Micromonosporaceae bacterium]